MAPLDSNVRKLPEPAAPPYRNAPQNIEAEQAVLGAIIVNNEAFYRVSDFLEPQHFFEPIHQQIYELASNLIRAGKTATPVTLKTFLPTDMDIGGLNASQLDKVVADGNVALVQPTRRGRGDHLVYTAKEGKYVLSGKSPSISDAERGTVQGDSLTFYNRDDRVLVESRLPPSSDPSRVAK